MNNPLLRMAPLAWVEGKPVYKGDRLQYGQNGVVTITGRHDDFILTTQEAGGVMENYLSWTR